MRITSIKPTKNDPSRFTIRAGGKVVATLNEKSVQALGLAVDTEWTDELAERVAETASRDKAKRDAMRMLNRRALSRGMLAERLARRGYDSELVDRIADELADRGLLDDEAFGRLLIRSELARKPAGERLLRHKLIQKKVPRDLIDRLLAEQLAGRDLVDEARDLAERRWHSAGMQRCDPATRKRRVWSMLARRGFDPETIQSALAGLPDAAGEPFGDE